jgi:hypothetical protein
MNAPSTEDVWNVFIYLFRAGVHNINDQLHTIPSATQTKSGGTFGHLAVTYAPFALFALISRPTDIYVRIAYVLDPDPLTALISLLFTPSHNLNVFLLPSHPT